VHDEDIRHKIRYDNITYSLISKKYEFKSLRDYYKLAFRVKHKSGQVLKVERSTYLFRVSSEGQPISQLSKWEVSENSSPFVSLSYYSPNYLNIMRDFYEMNAHELKLKYTPKEKEILELKNNQYNNKEIQEALRSNSIRTVEKHFENIIKKVKISFLERGESLHINSIREVLHFSKKFGLFPFY
jgi:DNA-binding CsgD family transcriptional regulator